jgi:hypothetical protein
MEGNVFTREEAEALLPSLRPLLEALRDAAREMRDAEAHVSVLVQEHTEARIDQPENPARAAYWAAVAKARGAEERAQGLMDEIRVLGAEVKDLDIGLIDFRCERGGQTVYLCWRLGEDGIRFWHDLNAGFAGRKPIEELEQRQP